MKEIEVKILDKNHSDLEPKLLSLGAKKVFEGKLTAIFFDDSRSSIRGSKQVLRLRQEGDTTFLTHKKKIPSSEAKIQDETEVIVSSFEDTKKILNSLGFSEFDNLIKNRISYKLNDSKIEFDTYLDKYDFVPEFLEIEATSVEEIHKTVSLLGFKKEDCKTWSTKDMIKYYPK